MKAKTSNKSSGNIEIVLGTIILIIVVALIINSFINNDEGLYKKMKKDAESFCEKAALYASENGNEKDIYYLSDINKVDKKTVDNKNCDIYDSYVEVANTKKVRLSCEGLLIEGTCKKKYHVYEIGPWQTEERIGETSFLYNYEKEGKQVLDYFLLEREFVEKYNKNEKKEYDNIDEIYNGDDKENIKINADIFYRYKKLVKEL